MKDQFRDTNSKDIWKDSLLLSQFLRGYTGLSVFEHVQPEDIEDETERFRYLMGVEFEGDTIKKIRLHGPNTELPVYVIALLDHKSTVDFDVTFQLLKYMVGIWSDYRNAQNTLHRGSSAAKSFRYPLIVPIVYYEGAAEWTAAMHWRERVADSQELARFVPDFTYHVFRLHEHSSEELLAKHEELSLIMLLNRIQTAEDLDAGSWTPRQRKTAQEILQTAPAHVVSLLANMIHHIGMRLNLPDPDLDELIKNVEGRNMGVLWANMEKMDIQEERRLRIEAQEKAQEQVREAQKAVQEARQQAEQQAAQQTAAIRQENDALRREVEELKAQLRRFQNPDAT